MSHSLLNVNLEFSGDMLWFPRDGLDRNGQRRLIRADAGIIGERNKICLRISVGLSAHSRRCTNR